MIDPKPHVKNRSLMPAQASLLDEPAATEIAQLEEAEQPTPPRGFIGNRTTPIRGFEAAKQTTGIEWTNATWNPMVGCTIHTAGCTNCYAMKQAGVITAKHYEGVVKWVGKANARDTVWTGLINQSPPHILNKPRTIKAPSMIFVNSMSDFFHENMQLQWQLDAMKVMEETERHTFQILTKRPENIMKFVEGYGYAFPENVWVGSTMERQDYTGRIDILRDIPATVRFLSIEPLIGPPGKLNLKGIHWVIIGGESGPGWRPMKHEWVKSAIDQCLEQNVPVFMKQWGVPENNPLFEKGGRQYVLQNDTEGKGGCLVDGVAYKQFPDIVKAA
jgi:protein gp37